MPPQQPSKTTPPPFPTNLPLPPPPLPQFHPSPLLANNRRRSAARPRRRVAAPTGGENAREREERATGGGVPGSNYETAYSPPPLSLRTFSHGLVHHPERALGQLAGDVEVLLRQCGSSKRCLVRLGRRSAAVLFGQTCLVLAKGGEERGEGRRYEGRRGESCLLWCKHCQASEGGWKEPLALHVRHQ
eukprot:225463-Chlamydomonas_euryale.AAC.1